MTKDGAVETAELTAGEIPEAIVQPEWSPRHALFFFRPHRLVGPLRVRGAVEVVAPVEAEIGGPHWVFGRAITVFSRMGGSSRRSSRTAQARGVVRGRESTPLDIGQVPDVPPAWRWFRLSRDAFNRAAVDLLSPKMDGGAPLSFAPRRPPCSRKNHFIGEPIEFPTRRGSGHAFWYAPKNHDFEGPSGDLPPLVVLSHGGPTSMTTNISSLAFNGGPAVASASST